MEEENRYLKGVCKETMDLLRRLKDGPEDDATVALERLRNEEDMSSILASIRQSDLGRASMHGNRDFHFPQAPSVSEQVSMPEPPTVTTPLSSLWDPSQMVGVMRSRRKALKDAFASFLECTGPIFYVYTQPEVDRLLDATLDQRRELSLSDLCEVCGIAALGSRFSRDEISPQQGQYYYEATKTLLEDCIETAPLRAIKVSALLAMCNIINKATVAIAYVDFGLSIARTQRLYERECQPDADFETWLESKRVFRTLITCKGWLQTSLSVVGDDSTVAQIELQDIGLHCGSSTEPNAMLQMQFAKLSIIQASIFRQMSCTSPDDRDGLPRDDALKKWFDQLPDNMRLEPVKGTAGIAGARSGYNAHIPILYLHLFYQGGNMLVYRWTLSRAHNDLPNLDRESLEQQTLLSINGGIEAAKRVADILYAVYAAGGAVKHCWLCIFQGFLSCCILLYDAAQNILANSDAGKASENLALASKSLEVLCWSSTLDPTARQYCTLLEPVFDNIAKATKNPSTSRGVRQGIASEHVHFERYPETTPIGKDAARLFRILYLPSRKEQSQESLDAGGACHPTLTQTTTNLAEAGLGVHLNWKYEFIMQKAQDADSSDGLLQGGKGKQPVGWSAVKSFTDASLVDVESTNLFM